MQPEVQRQTVAGDLEQLLGVPGDGDVVLGVFQWVGGEVGEHHPQLRRIAESEVALRGCGAVGTADQTEQAAEWPEQRSELGVQILHRIDEHDRAQPAMAQDALTSRLGVGDGYRTRVRRFVRRRGRFASAECGAGVIDIHGRWIAEPGHVALEGEEVGPGLVGRRRRLQHRQAQAAPHDAVPDVSDLFDEEPPAIRLDGLDAPQHLCEEIGRLELDEQVGGVEEGGSHERRLPGATPAHDERGPSANDLGVDAVVPLVERVVDGPVRDLVHGDGAERGFVRDEVLDVWRLLLG